MIKMLDKVIESDEGGRFYNKLIVRPKSNKKTKDAGKEQDERLGMPDFSLLKKLEDDVRKFYELRPYKKIGDILMDLESLNKQVEKFDEFLSTKN